MRCLKFAVLALLLTPALAPDARADLILTAESVFSGPGQTGTLVVTLQNTGPSFTSLSGYQIQLTTDVAWLKFTGVTRSAAAAGYVFPGASGDLSSDFGSGPVGLFTALDISVALSGFDDLAFGTTYGVLLVSFEIDALAPSNGAIAAIQFVSPGSGNTDLTQLFGDTGLLDFTAVDGQVTIQSVPAVPEPSSLGLAGLGLALVACKRGHLLRRRA